jgi:hypothetical protein
MALQAVLPGLSWCLLFLLSLPYIYSYFQAWIGLYQAGRSTCISLSLQPPSAGFLLGLLFAPKDGGNMFLQVIGLSPNYTALQQDTTRTSSPTKSNHLLILNIE